MSVNDLFFHQPDIYFSTNYSDNELIETENSKYSKIYPGTLLYQQYPDGILSAPSDRQMLPAGKSRNSSKMHTFIGLNIITHETSMINYLIQIRMIIIHASSICYH
jgi:hypothetical protein